MADNAGVAADVEVAANAEVPANEEEIDIAGLFRDAFERLTIEERRSRLLESAKSLQNKIQDIVSGNLYQTKIKEVSKILPEDVEPGDVRFRRITGLMDLMCEIAIQFGRGFAGFRWVDGVNQIVQMKPFIYEITILWMASCYDAKSDSIILFDKEEYIRESFILAGLEDIAEDLLDFATACHRMTINTTELSFLYMISIFDSERAELTPNAQESIAFCRGEYMGSFENYMVTEYESKGLGRIDELFEILPKAQTIAKKFRDTLNLSHRDKNYAPLFRELWISNEQAVAEPAPA